MIIEPNCDMPWEIYLDFLADQGFDDLRGIDPYSLTTMSETPFDNPYHCYWLETNDGMGQAEQIYYPLNKTGCGLTVHRTKSIYGKPAVSIGFDGDFKYGQYEINYNKMEMGCG